MEITEQELTHAEQRMTAIQETARAVSAVYEPHRDRVVVTLDTGLELAFPVQQTEGLAGAAPADLATIEISPAGLGLHWPKLDADVYLPAVIRGVFGSKRWLAQQLCRAGGRASSAAKTAAVRQNGCKGGRPRKQTE